MPYAGLRLRTEINSRTLGDLEERAPNEYEALIINVVRGILQAESKRLGRDEDLTNIVVPEAVKIISGDNKARNTGSFDHEIFDTDGPTQRSVTIPDNLPLFEHITLVMHEFIHLISRHDDVIGFHPVIQGKIARGHVQREMSHWSGVNEGVTDFLTYDLLLDENNIAFLEKYIVGFDGRQFRKYVQWTLDGYRSERNTYNPQIQLVADVSRRVAEYENLKAKKTVSTEASVRDDLYHIYLGDSDPELRASQSHALARRIERACGRGALRLLQGTKAENPALNISQEEADESIPSRTESVNDPDAAINTPHQPTTDLFENTEGSTLDSPLRWKYVMRRYVQPTRKIIRADHFPKPDDIQQLNEYREGIEHYLHHEDNKQTYADPQEARLNQERLDMLSDALKDIDKLQEFDIMFRDKMERIHASLKWVDDTIVRAQDSQQLAHAQQLLLEPLRLRRQLQERFYPTLEHLIKPFDLRVQQLRDALRMRTDRLSFQARQAPRR